ncbi:Transcription factor bHLH106 [Zea mays]|uniref:Transcription factor bHLH106 n=1 Tax=Zea mays TaxID=4577 RepID=A0A3L6FGL3_MAIZE|nr:Transcription factor bHLH106 [Zea mays]
MMPGSMAARQPLQGKQELQPYDGRDPSALGGSPVLVPRQQESAAPPAVRVAPPPDMSSSSGSGRSATEARALKVHSEAERRRRERINAHLATLRRMVPDTRQSTPLPPETDEVSIELHTGDAGADRTVYIRASISCADRPDLVAGLAQAFHGLRLKTVRANMTSLGGRARHVFVLCMEDGWGSAGASLRSLKEAVRQALARVASPETAYGSSPFQSKRQMILESH